MPGCCFACTCQLLSNPLATLACSSASVLVGHSRGLATRMLLFDRDSGTCFAAANMPACECRWLSAALFRPACCVGALLLLAYVTHTAIGEDEPHGRAASGARSRMRVHAVAEDVAPHSNTLGAISTIQNARWHGNQGSTPAAIAQATERAPGAEWQRPTMGSGRAAMHACWLDWPI